MLYITSHDFYLLLLVFFHLTDGLYNLPVIIAFVATKSMFNGKLSR